MGIQDQLFVGNQVRLTPIDYDKDPEVVAGWTQKADYLQMLALEPARPLSPAQVKKMFEGIEKEAEEEKNLYYFAVRSLESAEHPERLLGFLRLYWIEWNNGAGWIQLGIGDPADRRQGNGTEALQMGLRFAFSELNLFRLTAMIPEYNPAALRTFEKAGFVREVCQRDALYRFGHRWDLHFWGLLHEDWEARHSEISGQANG